LPKVSLSSYLLNALSNERLGNANIYVYSGTLTLPNQNTNNPTLPTTAALLTTKTSGDGSYQIVNLEVGTYTIIYLTSGYYREIRCKIAIKFRS
jgi:hypothetical protein